MRSAAAGRLQSTSHDSKKGRQQACATCETHKHACSVVSHVMLHSKNVTTQGKPPLAGPVVMIHAWPVSYSRSNCRSQDLHQQQRLCTSKNDHQQSTQPCIPAGSSTLRSHPHAPQRCQPRQLLALPALLPVAPPSCALHHVKQNTHAHHGMMSTRQRHCPKRRASR